MLVMFETLYLFSPPISGLVSVVHFALLCSAEDLDNKICITPNSGDIGDVTAMKCHVMASWFMTPCSMDGLGRP
jgi:hypothetical protein